MTSAESQMTLSPIAEHDNGNFDHDHVDLPRCRETHDWALMTGAELLTSIREVAKINSISVSSIYTRK